jgi:nicotinamide-nucleotide amidase
MIEDLRTAEILAVGSELLTPYHIDTNSLFLTGRLNELGIIVHAKAVVGDDRRDLAIALRGALARANLVIVTGGLGPTDDDLTREVAADVLGRSVRERADLLASIEERFTRRGVPMPSINRRQAQVPEDAVILPNANGTAPGLLLEHEGGLLALLPGPPREMQPMFEACVVSHLAPRTHGRQLRRRVVKVTGRSESQVEEVAFPVYSALGTPALPVQTTILASPGQIELHVSAAGSDIGEVDRLLDAGVARLVAALGSAVFSTDDRALEAVVGDALRARGWRVAVAESCTGGLLLGRLTAVPGSSAWVLGGVVAYANAVKVSALDVPEALLAEHGAVSEPVVRAMAEHVRTRLTADVGVAITGVAGPGGGSPQKPVGTVFISVAVSDRTVARGLFFPGDRDTIRRHSTAAALDMVRRAAGSGFTGNPIILETQ